MTTVVTDSVDTPDVRPGYTTTEFYLTLLSTLAPVLTIIFKHDVTSWVQSLAEIGAAIGTVAYIVSRTVVKHAAIKTATPAKLTKTSKASA